MAGIAAMTDEEQRVQREGDGFVVGAEILAAAFGIPAPEVAAMMRDGRITSRCEAGIGADAGRWRLTFYLAERACRLTVAEDGRILGRASFPVHRQG